MSGAEAVLDMSNERAELVPVWSRIGEGLRAYFTGPAEFPPPLLTLVRKLDAIEVNYPFRHPDATADRIHDWSAS